MGLFDPLVKVAEDVVNTAKAGAEAIAEGAEDAWDAATGTAEDAVDAAGDAFDWIGKVAGQAAEDAVRAALEAAQAAEQAAEDAAKAAVETAEDAARAFENAVNDSYDWGIGAAQSLATGAADAADWGIGAFETAGRAFVEDIDWEDVGAEFATAAVKFANYYIGGEDPEKYEDKSFADSNPDPHFAEDAGNQFAKEGGEDEPIGRVGQALGATESGPELSQIGITLDEARAHTGFGGVRLVESAAEGGSSSFARWLGDSYAADLGASLAGLVTDRAHFPDLGSLGGHRDITDDGAGLRDLVDVRPPVAEALVDLNVATAALGEGQTGGAGSASSMGLSLLDSLQPFGAFDNAARAGIIVVGGHDGPAAALKDYDASAAGGIAIRDVALQLRGLARETLDGVELPDTSVASLVDKDLFNESPFELPGFEGLFGGRTDILGSLGGKGPNGPGGLPSGLGGDGSAGSFEQFVDQLGRGGDFGDLFGGLGGIGKGGFGGAGEGGGLPSWMIGEGKGGGWEGLFGGGPDWGSAGGKGGLGSLSGLDDMGGLGDLDIPGVDLGGRKLPDIKLKGDDVMWHEEGNKVVADKGETLQVERGNKSFTVNEGKSFEKQEGDQFVSNKEPNTYYHVSDGKVEKAGGSNTGTDDKPHPGDPKGMPADGVGGGPNWDAAMPADGVGGGPNWSYAMPADDSVGGGPNWNAAMPADGVGGGPNWSAIMPADDSIGGGGPNWAVHDTAAVSVLSDTFEAAGTQRFATSFSALESDSLSAFGSHMWF